MDQCSHESHICGEVGTPIDKTYKHVQDVPIPVSYTFWGITCASIIHHITSCTFVPTYIFYSTIYSSLYIGIVLPDNARFYWLRSSGLQVIRQQTATRKHPDREKNRKDKYYLPQERHSRSLIMGKVNFISTHSKSIRHTRLGIIYMGRWFTIYDNKVIIQKCHGMSCATCIC